MRALFALLAGSLFGLGLMVSGMTDTTRVQGWLDVFGAWDPTLAFVLGGAVMPMVLIWQIAARRGHAMLGTPIPTPAEPVIDARLVGGSVLFGIGWAVVGLCPGPALAALTYGGTEGVIFLAAMIAGMWIHVALPSGQVRAA